MKEFFCENPEILTHLKPLTIQTFVDAMNMLFACIDERFKVTLANYKELVPTYMKNLGYATTISQSQMKCGKNFTNNGFFHSFILSL